MIVTATRRASRLFDVALAVSADRRPAAQHGRERYRQLTQVAPPLLAPSGSSETGGAGARIRGIGTVG